MDMTGAHPTSRLCAVLAATILAAGIAPAAHSQAASAYTLTDIGLGHSIDLNDNGTVIGAFTVAGRASTNAVWQQGTGFTAFGSDFTATSINDAGRVAGYRPFDSDPATHKIASTWSNGLFTDLGTVPGPRVASEGYAINASGQVAGRSYAPGNSTDSHGVVWSNGGITDLGAGSFSASDINDQGDIVGDLGPGTGGLLWSDATVTALPFDPRALNEGLQIAGNREVVQNGPTSAVLWENGVMTDLASLTSSSTIAWDINDDGLVVGFSNSGSSSIATIWSDGAPIDLNDKLLGPLAMYVMLTEATGVNDLGQIIANGLDLRTGGRHAYLLSPATVPLPAAGWLLFSGLGGFGFFLKRRPGRGPRPA